MSTVEDVNDLTSQISEGRVPSENFKAASQVPVHSVFGVNCAVTCEDSKLQPHLLEINSEQLFSWPALGD